MFFDNWNNDLVGLYLNNFLFISAHWQEGTRLCFLRPTSTNQQENLNPLYGQPWALYEKKVSWRGGFPHTATGPQMIFSIKLIWMIVLGKFRLIKGWNSPAGIAPRMDKAPQEGGYFWSRNGLQFKSNTQDIEIKEDFFNPR